MLPALSLLISLTAPIQAQSLQPAAESSPTESLADDMVESRVALAERLISPSLSSDERAGIIGELEFLHSSALQMFEIETRAELTRIARDKSLTGEEKIIRIEGWFSDNTVRIAEINRVADTLDQNKPLARHVPPAKPVDPSPEGTAATSLHDFSRSLAKGQITVEEFDRFREPQLDRLSTVISSRKPAPARLPAPPVAEDLDVNSDPEKFADNLHAQNRYLASLPESEAAEIRTDPDSSINRLLDALESRERASDMDERRRETQINQ